MRPVSCRLQRSLTWAPWNPWLLSTLAPSVASPFQQLFSTVIHSSTCIACPFFIFLISIRRRRGPVMSLASAHIHAACTDSNHLRRLHVTTEQTGGSDANLALQWPRRSWSQFRQVCWGPTVAALCKRPLQQSPRRPTPHASCSISWLMASAPKWARALVRATSLSCEAACTWRSYGITQHHHFTGKEAIQTAGRLNKLLYHHWHLLLLQCFGSRPGGVYSAGRPPATHHSLPRSLARGLHIATYTSRLVHPILHRHVVAG